METPSSWIGSKLGNFKRDRRLFFKQSHEEMLEHKSVHDTDVQIWAVCNANEFTKFRQTFTTSKIWQSDFKHSHGARKITKLVKKRDSVRQDKIFKSAEGFRQKFKVWCRQTRHLKYGTHFRSDFSTCAFRKEAFV